MRLLGGVGAVLLIAGAAISDAEDSEVARNRILGAAFLGLLCGVIALYSAVQPALTRGTRRWFQVVLSGLTLMAIGTLGEYLFLFKVSHQGSGVGSFVRGLAFMSVLLGAAILVVSATVSGALLLRHRVPPRLLGVLFLVFLPATIALAIVHPVAAVLPLASIGILSALWRYPAPAL